MAHMPRGKQSPTAVLRSAFLPPARCKETERAAAERAASLEGESLAEFIRRAVAAEATRRFRRAGVAAAPLPGGAAEADGIRGRLGDLARDRGR